MRNILVVWMLTGFWHGAAWNFILWGLLFAVLLILEKLWLLGALEKGRIWPHIYTLFFVLVSFVLFNAEDLGQAYADIGGLFGVGGVPAVSAEALYYLRSFGAALLFGVIGATPVPRNVTRRIFGETACREVWNIAEPVMLAVLLLISTAYLVDGSFNPFLYFRF